MASPQYWIVRSGTASLALATDGLSFTITSRRQPRIAVGDVVVLLEERPKKVFSRVSRVVHILFKEANADSEMLTTKVELEQFIDLPADLGLDSVQFSLTIVKNTKVPNVHFRRGYRKIPKPDFDTLVAAEPFVARTGYFELLNALPPALRVAFEVEEIEGSASGMWDSSFRAQIGRLSSFLDQRVFAAGRLLNEIEALASQLALVTDEGVLVQHLFSPGPHTPGERLPVSDDLNAQVQRFVGLNEELRRPISEDVPDGEQSIPSDAKRIDSSGAPSRTSEGNSLAQIVAELNRPERTSAERRFERLFARVR